jgi:hypothetical protein
MNSGKGVALGVALACIPPAFVTTLSARATWLLAV